MPYIKSVCIHADVKSSIAYILNPEKTEDTLYTASLNCLTNAEDAYLNMKFVYENYSHRKYNEPPPLHGKGWVKAIHYIEKQVNRYFDLLEKSELSETDRLQLKMCGSLA